ncbi:MAG: hypothetical protein N2B05_03265 [Gemmatimonadales bacterium]
MKRLVIAAAVMLVLVGDWAALHDILLGTEPDYVQEWTWLSLSTLVLAGAVWIWIRRRKVGGE